MIRRHYLARLKTPSHPVLGSEEWLPPHRPPPVPVLLKGTQLALFLYIVSFESTCSKLKLLLISSVRKSWTLTFENEAQKTTKVVQTIRMFWEVNLLLSFLCKYCHYLSWVDLAFTIPGLHFYFFSFIERGEQDGSLGELESS